MLLVICFHLWAWTSDPIPLVLKSGTVLECESYRKAGDWVVVSLVDGFDIKATENGPRKFKVAAIKIDWGETEKLKPVEAPRDESRKNALATRRKGKIESSVSPDSKRDSSAAEKPIVEAKSPAPEGRDTSEDEAFPSTEVPSAGERNGVAKPVANRLDETADLSEEIVVAPHPAEADVLQSETRAFCDLTFDGLGGEMTPLFFLEAGPYIFEMTHHGLSNFGAQIIEQNGKSVILLANEIGDFWGSKAVNIELTSDYHINVQADGEWKISIGRPKETDSAAPIQ